MSKLIKLDKTVIPACDFDLETLADVVKATKDIKKIGAYKIGFELVLEHGIPKTVSVIRNISDKPIIYDHQKAGTDVPFTGERFMEKCKKGGVDSVILFPQSGTVVQYEWTKAAQNAGLNVIIGGEMTHPRYLSNNFANDKKNNKEYNRIFDDLGMNPQLMSGYIKEFAPGIMYKLGARMGVTDFVMPGNKPEQIKKYKSIVEKVLGKTCSIYSPGLVAQGGEVSKGAKAAGESFHAIVGRGIYKAENIKQAALNLTSKL